jgi:hypothetical protein
MNLNECFDSFPRILSLYLYRSINFPFNLVFFFRTDITWSEVDCCCSFSKRVWALSINICLSNDLNLLDELVTQLNLSVIRLKLIFLSRRNSLHRALKKKTKKQTPPPKKKKSIHIGYGYLVERFFVAWGPRSVATVTVASVAKPEFVHLAFSKQNPFPVQHVVLYWTHNNERWVKENPG